MKTHSRWFFLKWVEVQSRSLIWRVVLRRSVAALILVGISAQAGEMPLHRFRRALNDQVSSLTWIAEKQYRRDLSAVSQVFEDLRNTEDFRTCIDPGWYTFESTQIEACERALDAWDGARQGYKPQALNRSTQLLESDQNFKVLVDAPSENADRRALARDFRRRIWDQVGSDRYLFRRMVNDFEVSCGQGDARTQLLCRSDGSHVFLYRDLNRWVEARSFELRMLESTLWKEATGYHEGDLY
jgi:hypothetical protein